MDLPPRQTGPDSWLGPAMASRSDWIVELGGAQIEELEAAAAPLVSGSADGLADLDAARFRLPTLGPVLLSLRRELLAGRGFCLLRGVPVERYSRIEAAAIFLGIGAHLGKARS
jgi:hypothetical protein